MADQPELGFRQRVEALVAQIPRGRVMTYGQIAALCGNARAARIVGGIAHFGDPSLPWQRVVNKSGGLAAGYPGGQEGHRQVLAAEGVMVDADGRVDIASLLWWPPSATPPLIVIVGETASGKSALALELAQRVDGEIICADSWTVRKEVNIGTAKPTQPEQNVVRHHLLDVVNPCQDFTAAVFKGLANRAIEDIAARGKVPIMVGGTGLFIDGVLYDFSFLAEGDRAAREELNGLSNDALLARIEAEGLELGDVDVRNKRRLIRLLETNGARPTRGPLRDNTLIIGLKTERETIKARIAQRVDAMLAAGLEGEVRELADKYDWACEALKGVGYAQWREYFAGSADIDRTRERIIKATVELAKRQRTWFKRNKSIHWVKTPVVIEEIVGLSTAFLAGKR